MSFIMANGEGDKVANGEKWETMRPIKANGKGYFKIGSIQEVYGSRNFKKEPVCKVLIVGRSFENIQYMKDRDFRGLGYSSKAEYLAQDYNQRQGSPLRVKYSLRELGDLLRDIETDEITPDNFLYWLDYCQHNPKIFEGVNISLIYDGCDCEDLQDAFQTIQANLRELIE